MQTAFPKKANTPLFSVIIVSHKSASTLPSLLESLVAKLPPSSYESIVVDNSEDSHEHAQLQKLAQRFPLTLLHTPNRGFGDACNRGAKKSRGLLLWFLNPDTEVRQVPFGAIMRLFQHNPATILGANLFSQEGTPQPWAWALRDPSLSSLLLWRIRKPSHRPPLLPKNVAWVSGASMIMSKELFRQLGGFDTRFFLYFEDVDLCRRARKQGASVLLFPSLHVYHHGGESFFSHKEQKRLYYQSQLLFFQKHYGTWSAKTLRFFQSVLRLPS